MAALSTAESAVKNQNSTALSSIKNRSESLVRNDVVCRCITFIETQSIKYREHVGGGEQEGGGEGDPAS